MKPLLVSLAALAYAVAVVIAAWQAPEKGFVAFTGRRIVDVVPGGRADRAGLRPGDVIVAVDGQPVRSTLEYATRVLARQPGETLAIDVTRAGRSVRARLTLAHAPPPWSALVATLLAMVLLGLGLLARYGHPEDPAARRFWRSTVIYAAVYAGGLSWTHLVVHPVLAAGFLIVLYIAPPQALDFALSFPSPIKRPMRGWRALGWVPSALLFAGAAISIGFAVADFVHGRATDAALRWVVRFVGWQLTLAVGVASMTLGAQLSNLRRISGRERAQLKWLLFGFALSLVSMLIALPVALFDRDRFLLVRYQPFTVAIAVTWFATSSLAVLRVRLADVDAVIHRSAVYAIASSLAAAIYLLVALAVGLLGGARLLPTLVAAVSAAALFGPIRSRVTRWLDRRFFRDRLHYVQALRELSETASRLREPTDLAREIVDRTVDTLRASSGALYLVAEPGAGAWRLMHARGASFGAQPVAPADGIAVPIASGGGAGGVLVLGPRRGGDLYRAADRDLLGALAGQLAIALGNARAYGTIAELSRALEAQNREIRELRDRLEDENLFLKGRLDAARAGATLIGSSKAMRELRERIDRLARASAAVLLCGESGSGKGLVARVLHDRSERGRGPFLHVDCGAIPEGVFESELFGHERGAFTGAVRTRRGPFELADGGTLLLDEIGELPLALQPKLLRALEERSFLRVGGTRPVAVDVRIVAATHRDLDEMVARGAFREDLYFRLRVVELEVPPLRTRKGDLPALVGFLLPRLCRRNHRPPLQIAQAALERLAGYGWPGNVRELQNVLERAVVLCEGREIQPDDLALPDAPAPVELPAPGHADHREVMESLERRRLQSALRAAGGNQSHAARKLGLARTTLINKLRRYGLL